MKGQTVTPEQPPAGQADLASRIEALPRPGRDRCWRPRDAYDAGYRDAKFDAAELARATLAAGAPLADAPKLKALFVSYGNAMYRNDPDAAEKLAERFGATLDGMLASPSIGAGAPTVCAKCGGQMKPGKAIQPYYAGTPDFPGGEVCTVSVAPGPASLIDCMKCSACGWSVGAGAPVPEPAAVAALRELVAVRDLNDSLASRAKEPRGSDESFARWIADQEDSQRRTPLAWEAARAAISGAVQPAEPEREGAAEPALVALRKARQFIVNGVALGYIRMPDADTPDSAHDTLPMIEAAIAALSGQPAEREAAQAPVDALRLFMGAAYPVSTDIDARGYRWSEAYLDQARAVALAASPAPRPDAPRDLGQHPDAMGDMP